MRSSSDTKFGPAVSVVMRMKSRIVCLPARRSSKSGDWLASGAVVSAEVRAAAAPTMAGAAISVGLWPSALACEQLRGDMVSSHKNLASSKEFVGDVRLRQFAKCMVQRGFRD